MPTDATSVTTALATLGGSGWTINQPTAYVGGAYSQVQVISGVLTASSPGEDITQTWNNVAVTFTGYRMNITDAASATASLLMDLQVGGVSKFRVRKDGTILGAIDTSGSTARGTAYYSDSTGTRAGSAQYWGWSSAAAPTGGALDTAFYRTQAKVVEVTDGTAGSYVGTALLLGAMTVAQLPAAAAGLKGARATVSDATATTFYSVVAGGGANVVPVFCTGAAWVIA